MPGLFVGKGVGIGEDNCFLCVFSCFVLVGFVRMRDDAAYPPSLPLLTGFGVGCGFGVGWGFGGARLWGISGCFPSEHLIRYVCCGFCYVDSAEPRFCGWSAGEKGLSGEMSLETIDRPASCRTNTAGSLAGSPLYRYGLGLGAEALLNRTPLHATRTGNLRSGFRCGRHFSPRAVLARPLHGLSCRRRLRCWLWPRVGDGRGASPFERSSLTQKITDGSK